MNNQTPEPFPYAFFESEYIYYLQNLGNPTHKINVKTNARPIKLLANWQKLTKKPLVKNCPITQNT